MAHAGVLIKPVVALQVGEQHLLSFEASERGKPSVDVILVEDLTQYRMSKIRAGCPRELPAGFGRTNFYPPPVILKWGHSVSNKTDAAGSSHGCLFDATWLAGTKPRLRWHQKLAKLQARHEVAQKSPGLFPPSP